MRALRCRKEHVQGSCGAGNCGTLGKKKRKVLWLDQNKRGKVGEASGEVKGPERHAL